MKYNEKTLIFVENRTDHYIQNGTDIEDFWNFFSRRYSHLCHKTGIILDIQQLYTSTNMYNGNFESEFLRIPIECIFGVHIHGRDGRAHQIPCKNDVIPWGFVRDEIRNLGTNIRPLHVLPEVLHVKHTEKTYEFCKDNLEL